MSDLTLLRKTNGLTDQELEQLFRDHYSMLYRTAYSILDNPVDAEDVPQTIFVQLLRKGASRDLLKNPKAYLYRAAVNASLNIIRSRRRQALESRDELPDIPTIPADTSVEDTHRRLAEALAELAPDAAQMLILRYVHNYSDADIARLLGKSRGLIAMKLFRTRLRLRKIMRSPGEQK
jgi:RNA polymerase sigma-70 factor (ECF subfamily)